MNEIGICQLCNRDEVPLREASSEAINDVSFEDIIEILSFQQIKDQCIKLCFKCQENAIIAYEFKSMCTKLVENINKLDDIIAYEDGGEAIEEINDEDAVMSSDNEQPSESSYFNEPDVMISQEEFIVVEEEVVSDDTYECVNGQYRCSICGCFYKNRDSLSRHLVRHKATSKLKCPYCPRQFYFNRDLNFHMKHHIEPTAEYRCEICSKNYSSKSALKKHADLHTNSKKFKCTFDGCSMAFARKFTLENHLRTHDDVRPFKCSRCNASFIQKNILQRHLKITHNEYFYKCEFCNEKSFEKKAELRVHYTECEEFLLSRQ